MAEIELTNGFENAILVDNEPDRVYSAEDVNKRFEGLVSSYGVYSNIGGACCVVVDSGLNVIVKSGKGEINNHYFKIESDTQLTFDAADVILNRIDSVVIRRSNNDRTTILTIKKGELASNPVAPTLERTQDIQEIFLANVRINANATTLTASNITDLRPSNTYCGFIACLVEQLNTQELFNQYQDAQNQFIEDQQIEFDEWFETIKDDVRATTLYREYSAVYVTTTDDVSTINIPSSINYSNNGLDVLNVIVNGQKLVEGREYTNNGTSITLVNTLDEINTVVEFINKKSVDGTAAESIVVQVESIQEQINNLSSELYIANGTDDNIVLSNMVTKFLNGTDEYSTVANNAQLKININGTLGIQGSEVVFDFNSSTTSNRKVILDFGNATIPDITITATNLALFSQEDNVIIDNANISITNAKITNTIYALHGGELRNSVLRITSSTATNIYGVWGGYSASNSKIYINSTSANCYGAYALKIITNNYIEINGSTSKNLYAGTVNKGVVIGNLYKGASFSGDSNSTIIANVEQ